MRDEKEREREKAQSNWIESKRSKYGDSEIESERKRHILFEREKAQCLSG